MIKMNLGSAKIRDPKTKQFNPIAGLIGESAYQTAVRLGTFSGSEEEWNKMNSESATKAEETKKEIASLKEDKSLYVYIDQSNVTNKITGITYLFPKNNSINIFSTYNLSITSPNYNLCNLWHYTNEMTYRISSIDNVQSASTGNNYACIKTWNKDNYKNYPNKPFNGLTSAPTVFRSGTRIVVKGVRA